MHDSQFDPNRYDVIPYRDQPHASTHPRRLETLATLFGMEPASILNCRVLELGCAAGGNLIPLAQDLDDSTFIGIELSRRQAEAGAETIETLGLENIELRHADLMEVDHSWGKFDYIICHGVLSWVEPSVQDEILAICKSNLAPNGVAFLSYNTYPGWHLAAVATDLMRYHASRFDDPREKIDQAKAMLEFMAETCNQSTAAAGALREELELLRKIDDDAYLFHDHLEKHNHPLYFSQLVKAATVLGLQYLAEVDFCDMLLRNLPEKVRKMLGGLSLVQQEQYMDFLRARRFRKTLLCHGQIELQRRIPPEKMEHLHLGLATDPGRLKIDARDEKATVFVLGDSRLTARHSAVEAALLHLKEIFPQYVSFDRLCETALSESEPPAGDAGGNGADRQQLRSSMLAAFSIGMVDVCVHPPRCTLQPGERPIASPLARLQASRGNAVTTQHHDWAVLDDLGRYVVQRLDGGHDRNALVGSVRQAIASGAIAARRGGQALDDVDPQVVSRYVDSALERIARLGCLVG